MFYPKDNIEIKTIYSRCFWKKNTIVSHLRLIQVRLKKVFTLV